jgi:hypothetical protein
VLKVSEQRGDTWVDRDCSPTFAKQTLNSGTERLAIGLPRSVINTFRLLAGAMSEPFFVLYVLHTPRGEGEPGRYQSEEISHAQLDKFLERFEGFLSGDARHDVWVRSLADGDQIVWTRHNDIFAYGNLAKFIRRLGELGFTNQEPPVLGDHLHHYRPEFDAEAAGVLSAFDWYRTPLRPEDEQ